MKILGFLACFIWGLLVPNLYATSSFSTQLLISFVGGFMIAVIFSMFSKSEEKKS